MSRSRNPDAYAEQASQSALFCGLPFVRVEQFLRMDGVTVVHCKKGEPIYSPDGFQKCIGILLYGQAAVMKREEDNSMLMSVLHPAQLFGAATLFSEQETYVAYIVAKESVWCLLIEEAALKAMMRKDFQVAENYMTYLTARIRFLSDRIDGFVQPSVSARLLAFIKENVVNGIYRPAHSIGTIAESLCISRATLYRAIADLVESENIERDGQCFRLLKGEHDYEKNA